MKQRKVPLRTCVVSNEKCEKKDLLRVVRNNEGEVFVDDTLKANGRGAYLSKSKEAVDIAKKKKILEKLRSHTATFTSVSKDLNVSIQTVVNVFDNYINGSRLPFDEVICVIYCIIKGLPGVLHPSMGRRVGIIGKIPVVCQRCAIVLGNIRRKIITDGELMAIQIMTAHIPINAIQYISGRLGRINIVLLFYICIISLIKT